MSEPKQDPDEWEIDAQMAEAAGPNCGHSHCSQNYIDTGETACVPLEGAHPNAEVRGHSCSLCHDFYGDSDVCDENKPPCSPHKAKGKSKWPNAAAEPGTLPRNVCHICRRLWMDCQGTCGAVTANGEGPNQKCEACTTFFARFRCNTPDECDCPKCQNYCECDEPNEDEDEDEGDPLYWSNEMGWVDKTLASRFDGKERDSLALPMHGEWQLEDGLFIIKQRFDRSLRALPEGT